MYMILYLFIILKYSNNYNISTETVTKLLMKHLTVSLCLSVGGLTIRNCKTVPLMVISSSMSSLAATFALNLVVMKEVTVSAVATITAL